MGVWRAEGSDSSSPGSGSLGQLGLFDGQVPGGLSQAPSFLHCWVLAGWHSSPPENASQRVQVPRSQCPEGRLLTTQTRRHAGTRRPNLGGPTLVTTPPPPAAHPPGWLGHHSRRLPSVPSPAMRLSTRWQRRLPDVVSLPTSPASTSCPPRTRIQDAGVTSPTSVAASLVLSA
ncbi:unnamed protein product [Rangifer tarandus platyrhynchus]|uniref:Uncharacterized protein n=1 Tax=Rangifer tarandus platyrhynchus TaxID=3082113 RepID=A0AC59Z0G4_RANTA